MPLPGFLFYFLDDILVLTCSKHTGKRDQTFLCSLFIPHGLNINYSKSEIHLTQEFSFLELFWDTEDISVSLPSYKCIEIQHLAHALLPRQPVTVCQAMSFLGETTFCTSGHAQLLLVVPCHLGQHVQCLPFPAHLLFFFLPFSSGMVSTPGGVLIAAVWSPCDFLFLMLLSLGLLFKGSGVSLSCCSTWSSSIPCKSSRLLHSCCIRWPFGYPVKWLP